MMIRTVCTVCVLLFGFGLGLVGFSLFWFGSVCFGLVSIIID